MTIEKLREHRQKILLKEHLRDTGDKTEFRKVEEEVKEVDDYISGIQDSTLRNIFVMVYVNGMTHEEAGEKIGYSRSRVSQIIGKQLED